MKRLLTAILLLLCMTSVQAQVTKDVLDSISTPNEVETSIGTLKFLDGAPLPETVAKAYDYLDTIRGVDAFFKGMPIASVHMLIEGQRSTGAVEAHEVMLMDKLMDSSPLYLTANTSTLCVITDVDVKRDGPSGVDAPAGMLGAINDAAFHWVEDIGPAGPDKGKGGKYLVLPPKHEGEILDGYFVVRTKSYRNWIFMRVSIADGLEPAAKLAKTRQTLMGLVANCRTAAAFC